MKLLDKPRCKIHTTEEILKDLNQCIVKKKPFSTIRYGDAVYGMVASFLCPGLIDSGKWKGSKGRKFANTIMGQLTIPTNNRLGFINRVVRAADNANYCDSFEAYHYLDSKKGVGIVGEKWKDIHECVGITNTSYCSCYLHYFSIVDGEYNLLNIMNGRKIFCVSNQVHIARKLQEVSGAATIDTYQIPRRGRSGKHFREHFRKIMNIIRDNARNYDLFLIGAGFLGKVYCDKIKRCGGRAFDAGRLFDLWSGVRVVDSRPKRFIKMNTNKMLCERIRKHPSGVW